MRYSLKSPPWIPSLAAIARGIHQIVISNITYVSHTNIFLRSRHDVLMICTDNLYLNAEKNTTQIHIFKQNDTSHANIHHIKMLIISIEITCGTSRQSADTRWSSPAAVSPLRSRETWTSRVSPGVSFRHTRPPDCWADRCDSYWSIRSPRAVCHRTWWMRRVMAITMNNPF